MHVVRAEQGVPYQPPGHHGVDAVRLQGQDPAGPPGVRVSVSRYRPGSWVDPAPTLADTVYVVLSGELDITADEQRTTLRTHDSVFLPLGEQRALRNSTGVVAVLLVVLLDSATVGSAQEVS